MPESIIASDKRSFNIRHIFRTLAVLIPLAIAGNIIYIVVASEPNILKRLTAFRPLYLLLAIGLVMVPWVAHAARMLLWSHAFGKKLRPMQAFKTALAADIGGAVTPTALGGGPVKLAFLAGFGFNPGEATLVTALGSIEDGIFFVISLPVAIIITKAWANHYVNMAVSNLISHWPIAAGAIFLILAIYYLMKRLNVKSHKNAPDLKTSRTNVLLRLKMAIVKYRDDFFIAVRFVVQKKISVFILCVLVSGVGWICRYTAISVLLFGLGFKVDPILFFLLQWVTFSTMAFIPTPGAVGGAEFAFAVVYSGLLPNGVIPLITGVWRFITFYMIIAIGAIFLAIAGVDFSENRDYRNKHIKVCEEIKA
jgi:glycosyltransferase 2 family protein